MKKILTLFMVVSVLAVFAATPRKIYINPGHGSWGPNDRPMATIPYPMLSSTGRPDTCGFYESNTNLWKGFELARRLQKDGYTIKMSRYANGPFPYVSSGAAAEKYNRNLSEICQEVESWGGDMFLSIHSNAAGDGQIANYPLFLYRGPDGGKNEVPGSYAMCQALWPYLVEWMKAGFEIQTSYASSMNIRGDWDFYHSYSTSSLGYTGYLGVLKHGTPGFLSEGYFHTYQPARHRGLNEDYCRQEGLRYYRGIVKYFGTAADKKGYIMGMVKDQSKTMDGYKYYTYKTGTHDAYKPINGATVRLRNAAGDLVGTYTVDNKWNGVFVFYDLDPGTYYIDIKAQGYITQQKTTNTVTVKANATTYPILYMKTGTSIDFDAVEVPVNITVKGGGTVKYGDLTVHDATSKTKADVDGKAVFTFTPDEGATLEKVLLNGEDVTARVVNNTYTIDQVSSNINLEVIFKKATFMVQVTCGANGSVVLPDTTVTSTVYKYYAEYGDTLNLNLQPKDGYEVKLAKHNAVDVKDKLVKNVYTIPNVRETHKFQVTFQAFTYTPGDLNDDGVMNVGDLTSLVSLIMSNYDTPGKLFRAADVNTDNTINVGDLTVLIQMIMQQESKSKKK